MSTNEEIQAGDYINYMRLFDDGIAVGVEHGAGYVVEVGAGSYLVRNGDREFDVLREHATMRAKQYRLEV